MTPDNAQTVKEKILEILQTVNRNVNILIKFLLVLSFVIPFLVLYSLDPYSFEATWKGRTFYIFFLWLVSLEIILGWEKLQTNKMNQIKSVRTVTFILALLLPTIYMVAANYYGLNTKIVDLSRQNNVSFASLMPLSTEYLVFAVLFALTVTLAYGTKGLMDFSISALFLGIIGVIYTIDNVYPYGKFTPFQIFVPTTATLAANVLNLLGYQTEWVGESLGTPVLKAWNSRGEARFGIAWPCSGVESLLIYTVTILLFLKKSAIPWKQRIIYFVIGALITYFINVLRIVTIFVIAINRGNWLQFHNYYGQLYSITWIIFYPLIIIGNQALWKKIKSWRNESSAGKEI